MKIIANTPSIVKRYFIAFYTKKHHSFRRRFHTFFTFISIKRDPDSRVSLNISFHPNLMTTHRTT